MKYRKKPVVIEAWQWNCQVTDGPMPDWLLSVAQGTADLRELIIPTLEGKLTASPGDWIIRGIKGEVYPCKPDIFEATYEALP
jgi:hypothetical protein